MKNEDDAELTNIYKNSYNVNRKLTGFSHMAYESETKIVNPESSMNEVSIDPSHKHKFNQGYDTIEKIDPI